MHSGYNRLDGREKPLCALQTH